ncbi:MAG TPA: hypothetical protein VHI77_07480 [Solirubrobacterales bacterium]|nr:hypothetical protein [Solirubrobacterales bacterium]
MKATLVKGTARPFPFPEPRRQGAQTVQLKLTIVLHPNGGSAQRVISR